MNETQQNYRQKRNALQRMEELERVLPELAKETDHQKNQLTAALEVIDALVQLVGLTEVQNIVAESRKARALDRKEREESAIAGMVEKGVLALVDTASPGNLIVFNETKDGVDVTPVSRVQFMFEQLKPEFQEHLKGKGVGATITSDQGNVFEVREIYSVQSPPQVEEETESTDASEEV